MRECWYFACNQCKMPIRTIVDNPSRHIKCSNCGANLFNEITKDEYLELHKEAYLGIDPGLNGGFAVVSGDKIHYKLVIPTISFTTKQGITKTDLDRRGILSFLKIFPGHTHVAIEQQEAFRGQNITSTCTTCRGYGILLMGLTAAHMDIIEVPSGVWQAHFNILPVTKADGKSTKEQALEVVKGIYPDTDFRKSDRSQKPHDGIVDAVLIANYCQFLFEGE